MHSRDWRMRIEDTLEALQRIQAYAGDMGFDAFREDSRTIDAVLRNLEVVGEAARHLPADVTEKHPEIPWQRMRGMRNVLAHEYFGVDLRMIWQTIQQDLPSLRPALEQLLKKD
jgi:uncharacterized protein with HEPN domain